MLQLLQVYQPVAVTLQTTQTAQAILFVAQAQPQQPDLHLLTPVLLQTAEVPTTLLLLHQEAQAVALLQAAEVPTIPLLHLQEAQVLLQVAEVPTRHLPLLLQEAQAAVLQAVQEALVLPVHADNPKGFLNTKRASAIPMLFFVGILQVVSFAEVIL